MGFLRRSLVGLFLLSLTVGALALAGNSIYSALQTRWSEEDRTRPRRERVFSVNVLTVEPTDVTPVMTAFGELRSRRTLDLRVTSAGTIVELADEFEDGGRVAAGDLLLRIDPADAQSALDRAKTDLTEAVSETREAARALDLARDELASAIAQVELRIRALTRQKDLRSRNVGTEAAVETTELAVATAEQAVLSRRQAVQQAEARIDQAATRLSRQQINLAEAQRRLSDTEIYAAFPGALNDVSVVEGGVVTGNERVAQLIDPKALEVAFRLSTTQYAELLQEDGALTLAPVQVVLDVFGADLKATGRISRESAAVGEGQTGRLLFARLDEAPGFRPGDFVTVRIEEPLLRGVVTLPASAVDASGRVLVIGEEDRLEEAEVTVLRRQGDDVLLRAPGLSGREVVAERSPLLGAGIRVRPLRPDVSGTLTGPELLELTPERRARLVAFVEDNQSMPQDAKDRVLAQLARDRVPATVVARIESRMGG